jgi:hypothetical protein
MMFKRIAVVTIFLAGCSGVQAPPPEDFERYYQEVKMACSVVAPLALATPAGPWVAVGCGTSEGLLKLASDPTSVAWLHSIKAKIEARW